MERASNRLAVLHELTSGLAELMGLQSIARFVLGVGLTVDAAGHAYPIGWTYGAGTSFPTVNGPDLTPNGALISLEGITKVYYTDELETHALADVHLKLGQGEFVAVSGPSRAMEITPSRCFNPVFDVRSSGIGGNSGLARFAAA
jgi:hypothetical protein